jgi:hypothetical protein
MKNALILILATAALHAQDAGSSTAQLEPFLKKAETAAICGLDISSLRLDHGSMPYEFAKAVVVSLYDAHAALQDAMGSLTDAQKDPGSGPFEILAAMMRGSKLAINDYACARRSITDFMAGKSAMKPGPGRPEWIAEQKSMIEELTGLLSAIYGSNILIHTQALQVLNRFGPEIDMTKAIDAGVPEQFGAVTSFVLPCWEHLRSSSEYSKPFVLSVEVCKL